MTNKILDLSILIKTFIRPVCLENILESIKQYQDYNKVRFASVVIVDDSDDDHKRQNKDIVNKFSPDVNINYKEYDFNSLGLSKGRNVGIKEITSKYLLLCDDDFLLCKECSLSDNINLLEIKDVDILGGVFFNISSKSDKTGSQHNWLGFITENETFDMCNIYTDFYPSFCHCDITQNFYIARREIFNRVQYPEDMPLLEHNIFFLRAKQANVRVAFTSGLYVKHLHINNNKKNYEGFRNRPVVNPIGKPVIGFLYEGNRIVRFNDYLNIGTPDVFTRNNYHKKQLNIVKIKGGLGNQMFQYAFARSIGDNTKLDINDYEFDKKRNFDLSKFNITQNIASQSDIKYFKGSGLLRKIRRCGQYKNITEKGMQYQPNIINTKNQNTYYDGYWQSEKYFDKIRPQLLSELSLRVTPNEPNQIMLDKIQKCNAVSLHVRRTDYISASNIYHQCSLEYYRTAIEYIKKHVDNPHFFIFSDDIEWVKQNLNIDCLHTFVDINDEKTGYFDLELMKNCQHNIIANSTFSWWGAWLNINPNKIVIAPKKWFVSMPESIIPENWIRL